MPEYQVLRDGIIIGQYTAQRPSVAATKALSAARRRDGTTEFVVGIRSAHKKIVMYRVQYGKVTDSFLGTLERPIATLVEPLQGIEPLKPNALRAGEPNASYSNNEL
jgi:hypothetical protein